MESDYQTTLAQMMAEDAQVAHLPAGSTSEFTTDLLRVTTANGAVEEESTHSQDRQPKEGRLVLLQLILDTLPISVNLVRGYDARLVLANRAATTVWGASWPPGQPMSEFLTTNGICIFGIDGRPLAFELLATLQAIRQGKTVYQHQEIIRHPDGTSFPVLVNAVALNTSSLPQPLPDLVNYAAGKVEPAAIVIHQDVTILKEAEQLKDEFISIAVHELRNPLAVLRGFAEMLIVQTARGKGLQLADWQREALDEIDQATRRLDNLTGDLLDVTRIQAGQLVLHRERVDLVDLTRHVVMRIQTTTKQHWFSIDTPVQRLIVYVDPERIEQVLNNLIGNAIKYSPQGGAIEVAIREETEEQVALLSVRDHGIGIPLHQQACIFGRFMRADNAQDAGIGGTGLGLYLSRGLVEQHGGRIWFESVERRGSTFFISLPAVAETAPLGL